VLSVSDVVALKIVSDVLALNNYLKAILRFHHLSNTKIAFLY